MLTVKENKGFAMSFENGLTISVQFGVRNYCSARDFYASFGDEKKQEVWESADCEIAIIGKKQMWHNFGDDEVKGWVGADEVADWIHKVKNAKCIQDLGECKDMSLDAILKRIN